LHHCLAALSRLNPAPGQLAGEGKTHLALDVSGELQGFLQPPELANGQKIEDIHHTAPISESMTISNRLTESRLYGESCND
jgi:hypothetical protein